MKPHFLKSSGKRKILAELEEQFGISELPYLLIESGKGKLRGFSGHLSREEILKIAEIANVEIIGLYILRKEEYNQLRISFDYSQILKNKIKKNIIEINDSQLFEWLKGNDIEMQISPGIFAVKNREDFFGCAKSSGFRILNHVPKERRLKK